MKTQIIRFLFAALMLSSCNDSTPKQNYPEVLRPTIGQTSDIRTKDDIRQDGKQLVEKLKQTDLAVFDDLHFEDVGYKLTVYLTKNGNYYTIFGWNDPIDRISCLVGLEQFSEHLGFSEHYNSSFYEYRIDKIDSTYRLLGLELNQPEVILDELSANEFNKKYPSKYGDIFEWMTVHKELMKELNLFKAGVNSDYSRYAFTMSDYSTVFYYPDGMIEIDKNSEDNGEWLEEEHYYLTFGN